LNGRAISLTIVAFLLGALAAGGVSVRVIREVKTVDDATSLPPQNIAPDETESVTITEAVAPFPVTIDFVLSEAVPVVDIGFGFTVELLQVTDQAQTSVVQVAVVSEDAVETGLRISGAGPGWASAPPDRELGGRTTLTWSGEALPDEILLSAAGVVRLPIGGEFAVTLDGGQ